MELTPIHYHILNKMKKGYYYRPDLCDDVVKGIIKDLLRKKYCVRMPDDKEKVVFGEKVIPKRKRSKKIDKLYDQNDNVVFELNDANGQMYGGNLRFSCLLSINGEDHCVFSSSKRYKVIQFQNNFYYVTNKYGIYYSQTELFTTTKKARDRKAKIEKLKILK